VNPDFPGYRGDDVPGDMPEELPGDIVSSEPGLGALLGMLSADATPDELTGESAALAMFRANRQPAVPAPSPAEPDLAAAGFGADEFGADEFGADEFGAGEFGADEFGAGGTRPFQPLAFGPPAAEPRLLEPQTGPAPRPIRRSARIDGGSQRHGRRVGLMAAAVTLAAAAGFAVAAYTEALPAPLQQAAYHVLGFVGVPAAHNQAPSEASSTSPGHARGHGSHKAAHSKPAASASPQPSDSGPASAAGPAGLSITVAHGRIQAGQSDMFIARLTGHAGGVAGASVTLLERRIGQMGWNVAGTATTGSNGSATITVPDLTSNAAFRIKGPHGGMSQPVLVTVTVPVSASVSGSGGMASKITVSSPLAAPGNIAVLQIMAGTHWMNLQMSRLNGANQAQFMVRNRAMQRMYRVVLLPTASHALSVSNAVKVPPR
jgi:hypothetical protein